MTALLQARNLSCHFRLRRETLFGRPPLLHAVDGVDLTIHAGEALGLVGESGCGKSTLARLLARLLDPTGGQLFLHGAEISRESVSRFARSDRRRAIQMVFQDPTESLNPLLTVFQSIADPGGRLLGPLSRTALRQRVEEAAAAVNLPLEFLDRYPHQLSGGQKARVGIARALVVEPQLLVLDEPTSALDVSVQATVLQLLDRLRRDRGIALLFVSHDLNVVRLLCQRIAVMYLGEIVETGAAADIYRAPAHPYTRALLSAIPSLRPRGAGRIRLDGEPQSPVNPCATRCRFAGRCFMEQPLCTQVAPELRALPGGRQVRCHYAG
ncbi:oligopeptide/dipeptide ABC transporter, ATP-binding protein, C-terminal domain-containing protein [Paracoccus solventivorans]|uniref:Oligopeptide/dipeptide ABC transporter, ATP-binding protein, C-terminal domain-containing protein n=1 Tax=Paracoccus solventivorans TaxID=53463 RepID=A0A1M7JE41_9RHOB|nr:oligopeptide/dipeptide ABC transporter ATP-binding protein [Paracoccus solventivorans]SHM51350.1 oligopeptide/dipeptide ABC transporter, ATP-binding protein, C-terminal domain-containing protein [Paracoccus solventivorans]